MGEQPDARPSAARAAHAHAGFPCVMAVGIVSIASRELGHDTLSLALAAAAGLVYVLLLPAWSELWRYGHAQPEAFAAVAATAVLGTRLAVANVVVVPDVALALAALAWAAMWVGLRRAPDLGDATGTRLLLVVATQSLVVLGSFSARPLAPAELALFVGGVALYPVVVATIALHEVRRSAGDVWITMGALAISTLAAARLSTLLGHRPLAVVAVILWALATATLPVLAVAELRWPRPRFDPKRWGTVFPLGMYAAATVAVAHTTPLREWTVAHVALWFALAVGAATAAGTLRAAVRDVRRARRATACARSGRA
jgi:tellurite resistance protein TehA-like permease